MTTFRLFREYNDVEGETWNFWLQVDGNAAGLAALEARLARLAEETGSDPEFELTEDELTNTTSICWSTTRYTATSGHMRRWPAP